MQELIDELRKTRDDGEHEYRTAYNLAIAIANEFLEKEKEQIKDAWDAGMSEGIGTTMASLDYDGDFNNYYNETYNQNK